MFRPLAPGLLVAFATLALRSIEMMVLKFEFFIGTG